MRVDAFDFDLPRERIAERPASPRDAARLLHVRADALGDLHVRDLPDLVAPGDVIVVNDSRVIPARLYGLRMRPGVDPLRVEILLHKAEGGPDWRAFARPGKRLKAGDALDFGGGFRAEVTGKSPEGDVGVRFDRHGADLIAALEAHGEMPLPPYIHRDHGADDRDKVDYQTVYARAEGSVAAPTAGLHFTPELLARLDAKGAKRVAVTLHVGAGTFLPVKAEDTENHKMHAEWGTIAPEVAEAINAARAGGGRLLAVGTTATRILETAADGAGIVHPFAGETAIFLTPGYRFRAVDRLMTNFHLPKSTLFMLVSAFAGLERMQSAYAHAIATGYRFYSYGDSSLLEGAPR
ncbi:S-adenosylmethionine:tRNA ribosyltransferase-isomerase [uncultured Alphaproteobacteria bacterium]|uniref:S-adenosylmethionine:tRNA ribosyltransferase-isomerase n=1 Tax=uncultured Alphaproteobacteria bacterium TaxID=91750 RepID=A0A212JUK7_9PROT|nr:S-adenosylmethionine:tRNA ribosyltransferase-isomerase [uncultured Alphaproteobacteria bacterium]